MRTEPLPISWESEIVGWMEFQGGENWYLYGKWVSAGTEATARFLKTLAESDELLIQLGASRVRIHEVPDERGMIEVKYAPAPD